MSKCDLSDAFRHILMHCEDWKLLGSAWQIDIKSTLTMHSCSLAFHLTRSLPEVRGYLITHHA